MDNKRENTRGEVKIFIYGMTCRVKAQVVQNVRDLASYHDCDEAWIVTSSVVDKSATQEAKKDNPQVIYCYNFDELIEEIIDFSNYFSWLEDEVESKNINQ